MFKKFWNKLKLGFNKLWSELKLRWKSTAPSLFKKIQNLSIFLGSLSGLAILLKSLNVELPGSLSWVGDRVIIVSAILSYAVAKLPVDMDKASDETKKAISSTKPDIPE